MSACFQKYFLVLLLSSLVKIGPTRKTSNNSQYNYKHRWQTKRKKKQVSKLVSKLKFNEKHKIFNRKSVKIIFKTCMMHELCDPAHQSLDVTNEK